MPGLDAYAALAPFQIEELVDAANSILRDRPRLKVSKRTVRYYVTQGVVPAPRGAPKFARYGMEHLARLVGARALQDEGRSLEEAVERLDRAFAKGEAFGVSQVQRWVDSESDGRRSPMALNAPNSVLGLSRFDDFDEPALFVREDAGYPVERDEDASTPVEVLRFPLAPDAVLEVRRGRPLRRVLLEARRALEGLLDQQRDDF